MKKIIVWNSSITGEVPLWNRQDASKEKLSSHPRLVRRSLPDVICNGRKRAYAVKVCAECRKVGLAPGVEVESSILGKPVPLINCVYNCEWVM